MRPGRHVIALLGAAVLVAPGVVGRAAASTPAADLRAKAFSVVAVVDSGINPYHVDFRRPDLVTHPSRYVEGFPKGVPALRLTLDQPHFETAFERDAKRWASLGTRDLVWIPGTNIIGAIGPFDAVDPEPNFYDRDGHGTSVASLAGGGIHGPGSDDVLLVIVSGHSDALEWAARQPWIDVITNSWSELGAPDYSKAARASRRAVAAGKIVCFAGGNVPAPLWMVSSQGPSWNVNVGAASAKTRGEHVYSAYPNDVLGLAGADAAMTDSIEGARSFAGTSAATPAVCGHIARSLAMARAELGDTVEGPHQGGLAVGARRWGRLEDGVIDRTELEDAIQSTARPAEPAAPDPDDPNSIPALPGGGFIRGGYGIVDRASATDALAVLLGRERRPERLLEDAWIGVTNLIRDGIWGSPP